MGIISIYRIINTDISCKVLIIMYSASKSNFREILVFSICKKLNDFFFMIVQSISLI